MTMVSTFSKLAIIAVVMLLIYASVQQTYRSNANDPQLQMARDISTNLAAGKSIENIFPKDSIDISRSLSAFVVLYDKKNVPVRSSGFLNGRVPQLPQGVFDFAKSHGEDVITWQPQRNARMAMVVVDVQSADIGFVAAGRSLNEVETRESNLVKMVFLCWVICSCIVIINEILQYRFGRK